MLVQTDVGRAALVADRIAAVDGVIMSQYVVGPFDVIVRIGAVDSDALSGLVHEIKQVDGITRTLTCPVA